MADLTELIEEARRLGTAIAEHPVAQAYAAAQQVVQGDDATRALLSEYQSVAQRVQELTA